VVPEVDGYEGQAMVFVGEDDEAVGQGELFVLQLGDLQGLGGRQSVGGVGDRCNGHAAQQRGRDHTFGYKQRCFHLFSTEAGRGLGRVPAYSNRKRMRG
jgi:hypothetical protein